MRSRFLPGAANRVENGNGLSTTTQAAVIMSNGSGTNTKRLRRTQESPSVATGTSMASQVFSRLGDEITIPLDDAAQTCRRLLGSTLSADHKKQIEGVMRAMGAAATRANAYVDLLRLDAGELPLKADTLDIEEVIAKAVAIAQPKAKAKGLVLLAERSIRPVPRVSVDLERLFQVLGNLIDNAIAFTERGQVTLSTEIYDRSIAVHVVDTGLGIPADTLPRLFEDFFHRTAGKKVEPKRAGLGLTLCRKLVIRMGGDLWVSSTVGAGSRFSFTVPRAVDSAGRARHTT
jgi:signal transduction histidine kinase